MSQNSSFSDIFEDGCDLTYDPLPENLKYLTQLFYMVPGIIIHFRILSIMLFQHRKIYMIQSFFIIFSMDSIAVGFFFINENAYNSSEFLITKSLNVSVHLVIS